MEEKIELIVKVTLNYDQKEQRDLAIKRAKESVLSCNILGSVGCKSTSARLKNK